MGAVDVVARLQRGAAEPEALARRIKNDAVGNVCAKRAYVAAGAVRTLLALSQTAGAEPPLVSEALSALCTLLVRCEQGVAALLAEPHALDVLLQALHAPPPLAVAHAAARALKVLVTSPHTPTSARDAVADRPLAVAQLVAFAAHSGPICATAAATLAAVIRLPAHAASSIAAGALHALLPALAPRAHPVRTDAALNALASLADADPHAAAAEIAAQGAALAVLPLVRRTQSVVTRLAACRLLARLRRAHALDGRHEKSQVINTVIPQLISLLTCDDRNVRREAALVLSEMVEEDDAMQQRATEQGAVACLAKFFARDTPDNRPSSSADISPPSRIAFTPENTRGVDVDAATLALPMARAALDALAALCANLDEARDRVVEDAKLWPKVIDYLGADDPEVVLAAARCVRSLTRSVKILRGDICDQVVVTLFIRLLESSHSAEVRRCVSAAVCNVVVGFSPVQQLFLERGGVGVLVRLLRTDDPELKKSALCALKNVLFKAGVQTKQNVMGELGYDNLVAMCKDDSADVRELALHILRNLACFGSNHNDTTHIDVLLKHMGDDLFNILERALQGDASSIAIQTLYTSCNIASGDESHKARMMNSQIPTLILRWLQHHNEQARIAALWCTINLSRKEHDPDAPSRPHVQPLRRRTFEALSRRMTRLNGTETRLEPRSSQESLRHSQLDQDSMVVDSNDDDAEEPQLAVDSAEDTAPDAAMREPMDESADGEDAKAGTVNKSPTSSQEIKVEDQVAEEMPVQPPKASGYEWRIAMLRELGYEQVLTSLTNDPHVEVQGRARAALEQFTAAPDADALDYLPCSLLTRLHPPESQGYHPAAVAPSPVAALRVDTITAVPGPTPPSDDSSGGDYSEGSTLTTAGEEVRPNPPPGLG